MRLRQIITEGFGSSDPYLYHASERQRPLQHYLRGLLPSPTGYSGPGVYLATTPHDTLWNVERHNARFFRVSKAELIRRYGTYPDVEDGLEFDPNMKEVLLSGQRIIPAELLEVLVDGKWIPLADAVEVTRR